MCMYIYVNCSVLFYHVNKSQLTYVKLLLMDIHVDLLFLFLLFFVGKTDI